MSNIILNLLVGTVLFVFNGSEASPISLIGTVVMVDPNDPLPWTEMDFNRSPPLSPEPYYSREELRCFEERKVYQMGQCWTLLTRGPCEEGEWLVLDLSTEGIRSQCAPKLCASDKAFWLPTKECVPLKDKTKCTKKETSLQVNSLGYGACKCASGSARAMAENGACYLLYSRGFCDPGYVVAKDVDADESPAICVPDICKNSTSTDTLMLPYKGGCYPEGSEEPCPEDESLSVDVHSGIPRCSHSILTWHLVNPPPRCSEVDHNGDCRDRLTIDLQKDNFISDINSDRVKHRKKFNLSKG